MMTSQRGPRSAKLPSENFVGPRTTADAKLELKKKGNVDKNENTTRTERLLAARKKTIRTSEIQDIFSSGVG